MDTNTKVAICSRSFSKHPQLRKELLGIYQNVKFNDAGINLKGDELIDFLEGFDKAIIGLEQITEALLVRLPKLKVISKYGVGLDSIDLQAMHKYRRYLGWKGGVNKRSVAELVIAFSIMMLRKLPQANLDIKNGHWNQFIGGQLSQKTFGIVGCGNVGKDLIKLLEPFNCKVLTHDLVKDDPLYESDKVKNIALEELLPQVDILSLHLPLDASTQNIIDAKRMSLLKSNAILINTARGGLVDERELKRLLIEGKLAAAAFDVFSIEPPTDSELLNLPNFFSTPHLGGSAAEAILAMGFAAIEGLSVNQVPEA